jgi:hypothetical protein
MPEYDPTNYPKPTANDLTRAEAGRDTTNQQPTRWPSSSLVPDAYAGPTPDREFETSGGPTHRGTPAPAVLQPPDAPAPLESVSPPPGHTAQP